MSFRAALRHSQQPPTSVLVPSPAAVGLCSSPRLVEVGDSRWDHQNRPGWSSLNPTLPDRSAASGPLCGLGLSVLGSAACRLGAVYRNTSPNNGACSAAMRPNHLLASDPVALCFSPRPAFASAVLCHQGAPGVCLGTRRLRSEERWALRGRSGRRLPGERRGCSPLPNTPPSRRLVPRVCLGSRGGRRGLGEPAHHPPAIFY